MQEILQEDQSAKVERSANKAKRDGDECRWIFDEVEEFHFVFVDYLSGTRAKVGRDDSLCARW